MPPPPPPLPASPSSFSSTPTADIFAALPSSAAVVAADRTIVILDFSDAADAPDKRDDRDGLDALDAPEFDCLCGRNAAIVTGRQMVESLPLFSIITFRTIHK